MSFDIDAAVGPVQGANDTSLPLIPEGEYPAIVDKYEGRQIETKRGPATVVDITWAVDDATAKEVTGMEKPTIRQSVFLDMTAEGGIDMGEGKNVQLGRLREALGLNNPDVPFEFSQLAGQAGMILVSHNPDKNDPDTVYANVKKVGQA